MKSLTILLLFILITAFKAVNEGRFVGKVVAEWMDNDREMKLIENFNYIDPRGVEWPVPKGYEFNGASIPEKLWSFVGSPYTGPYRRAAVIHDYYTDNKVRDSFNVHTMFFDACITGGVKRVDALGMFLAVLGAGGYWDITEDHALSPGTDKDGKKITNVTTLVQTYIYSRSYPDSLYRQDSIWLEQTNPSLEEIRNRVNSHSTLKFVDSEVKILHGVR